MPINFIGTGSAFNFNDGSCSAYFIDNGNLFLLDCGETTYSSLLDLVDFKTIKNIYILISHLHNDHIGSLGTAISDLYINYKLKVNVVFPLDTVANLLTLMGVSDEMYNHLRVFDLSLDDIHISFIETKHSKWIKSYGFLIKLKEEIIYYSGDSNTIPTEIRKNILNGKIDKIYQDVTIVESYSDSHMYYKTLLKILPTKYLDKVYCMHLDEGSIEILEESGLKVVKKD